MSRWATGLIYQICGHSDPVPSIAGNGQCHEEKHAQNILSKPVVVCRLYTVIMYLQLAEF